MKKYNVYKVIKHRQSILHRVRIVENKKKDIKKLDWKNEENN